MEQLKDLKNLYIIWVCPDISWGQVYREIMNNYGPYKNCNKKYLKTKKEKMGHLINLTEDINLKEKFNKNLKLEIKFLINSKEISKIKNKILKIPGIVYKNRAYEKTIMFDNLAKSMQKEDARLRVRQIIDQENGKEKKLKIEFSYKRRIKASGGIKQEEEIESEFDVDFESFLQILNKMGYEITTSYERYRETYLANNIKITFDEFPFGYILEIEGDESGINKMCKILNLDKNKSYPLSCDDIYAELCEKKGIKVKDHILFNDSEMPHI